MTRAKVLPWALQMILPQNQSQPLITPVGAVTHTAVDSPAANSLYWWFRNPSAKGAESHLWLRKDGVFEQYMHFDRRADAQFDGNKDRISIETEDDGDPLTPWTQAQQESLLRLMEFLEDEWSIPVTIPLNYLAKGWGWHSQFWNWAKDGHTCPGPVRIEQHKELVRFYNTPIIPGRAKLMDSCLSKRGGATVAVILNGKVHIRWQTAPNNGWSGYLNLHAALPDNDPGSFDTVTIFENEDGRQEIWAMHSAYGAMFGCSQTAPGAPFGTWARL
jgi:hypothetical protein